MFTGIIENIGKITEIRRSGELKYITLECSGLQEDLQLGDSICCNGICLTVTAYDNTHITAAAMPETITKTTLSSWNRGSLINLERALTLQSRLGGHLVQGHVDTTGSVKKIDRRHQTVSVHFPVPAGYSHLLVEHGSIAVDGASLTISSLEQSVFSVSLVDFTLQHTNLSNLKPGHKVNLEFDIIGKYIARNMERNKNKLSADKLYEMGY